MFGLVASGRWVATSPQQIDVNKFVFPLADPHLIHHVVVFLLGTVPLDPAFGVSVYLCWSNPEPCWQYLGFISNDKPSAIFKLNYAKKVSDRGENPFGLGGVPGAIPLVDPAAAAAAAAAAGAGVGAVGAAAPVAMAAQIGLSVEPLDAIAHQAAPDTSAAVAAATAVPPADYLAFPLKMLESFHNFAASFAMSQQQAMVSPGEQYVPYSVLQKWHEKYRARLQHDPNFWKES